MYRRTKSYVDRCSGSCSGNPPKTVSSPPSFLPPLAFSDIKSQIRCLYAISLLPSCCSFFLLSFFLAISAATEFGGIWWRGGAFQRTPGFGEHFLIRLYLEAPKPTQNPEIPKNTAFTRTFRKVHVNFCFLPVTRASNPTEIVQKNAFR